METAGAASTPPPLPRSRGFSPLPGSRPPARRGNIRSEDSIPAALPRQAFNLFGSPFSVPDSRLVPSVTSPRPFSSRWSPTRRQTDGRFALHVPPATAARHARNEEGRRALARRAPPDDEQPLRWGLAPARNRHAASAAPASGRFIAAKHATRISSTRGHVRHSGRRNLPGRILAA